VKCSIIFPLGQMLKNQRLKCVTDHSVKTPTL
jgi:hypothetical protein